MNTTAAGDTVQIRYGQSGLQVRLPQDARATVIRKRPMAKLPDPRAAVRDALGAADRRAPFSALVHGARAPAS
jgi:hypothetical protein